MKSPGLCLMKKPVLKDHMLSTVPLLEHFKNVKVLEISERGVFFCQWLAVVGD